MLGHKILGTGKNNVLFLHGWFSDSSYYNETIRYLDQEKYTFLFVDFRGYGLSRSIEGSYTLEEIINDIKLLVDHYKWESYHIVCHSMAGLVGQKVLTLPQNNVLSLFAITPVGPKGAPVDAVMGLLFEQASIENTPFCYQMMDTITSNRYFDGFSKWKVSYWKSCSTEEARLGYLKMFTTTDISQEINQINAPLTIVIGVYDFETYNREALQKNFQPYYPHCRFTELQTGHFPLEEAPIFLAKELDIHLELVTSTHE